jgi:diacylglycerol kinase
MRNSAEKLISCFLDKARKNERNLRNYSISIFKFFDCLFYMQDGNVDITIKIIIIIMMIIIRKLNSRKKE